MITWIIFTILLKNLNFPYIEIEGKLDTFMSERHHSFNINSGKYYWFEFENKIHLLYFNNNLETHENPFLLLILIIDAKGKRWYEAENNQLLLTAFDNFHTTSAFFSLLPNEQNRNCYEFMAEIYFKQKLYGEIKLTNTIIFINLDYRLNELENYNLLLQHVKVGTLFWHRFYQLENLFFELVLETYYIVYQEDLRNLYTNSSFRVGSLVEISLGVFEVLFVREKVFLKNRQFFFELYPKKNSCLSLRNAYYSSHFFTNSSVRIQFDFKEDERQQFKFFFEETLMDAWETGELYTEGLLHIGQRTYVFRNDLQEIITVEIPTYDIRGIDNISILLISLKFVTETLFGSPE